VDLEGVLRALFTDPTYGIPLLVAVALAALVGWWSLKRTAPLPPLALTAPSEAWRLQLDALVYSNLREGRYSAAVDALGRCLAVTVRERFRIPVGEASSADTSEVDRLLPPPTTLRSLFKEINDAYAAAAWAEQKSWWAQRWPWLARRQQRRAVRSFARLSTRVVHLLGVLEVE
jgi:hypothetical protein